MVLKLEVNILHFDVLNEHLIVNLLQLEDSGLDWLKTERNREAKVRKLSIFVAKEVGQPFPSSNFKGGLLKNFLFLTLFLLFCWQ